MRIAAARFRQAGIGGLSVADLMKEAGLTHGGFYRHFESRDDLVAEAIAHALDEGDDRIGIEPRPAEDEVTLSRWVDAYLAEAHRDAPAEGCAVAALAGDVARSHARTRTAFSLRTKKALLRMADVLPGGPKQRAHAILIWCALVGALTLARAVNDKKLSSEILDTVRGELKSLFAAKRRK
ncbi:TetR/AcrR family transcriptional regulator [Pendulispora brunnea]|uniref:TetR/AcrR family transcriptional regulator n=1 Tax=Pendulispora brunnea TaxID=2905690 RepID=A0ABZ2K3N4_9BACT